MGIKVRGVKQSKAGLNRIINDGFDCPSSRVMQQADAPEIIGDNAALESI